MSDYLAGMTARSEHTQMNKSRQPVLDFDRRGYDDQPGWVTKQLGKLFQSTGRALTSLGERMNHEQTLRREIPSQKEANSLAGGD